MLNFVARQPLWTTLTESLSAPEHDEIERLIGRILIANNKALHNEIAALVEILNDEFVAASRRPSVSAETRRILQTPNKQFLSASIRLLADKLKQQQTHEQQHTSDVDTLTRPLTARQSRLVADVTNGGAASHRSMLSSSSMSLSLEHERPSSRSSTRSALSSARSSRPITPHDTRAIALPHAVSLQTIDSVITALRAAFADEHQMLLDDISHLQKCMEQAADVAIAAEVDNTNAVESASESELAELNALLQSAVQQHDDAHNIEAITSRSSSKHHLPSLNSNSLRRGVQPIAARRPTHANKSVTEQRRAQSVGEYTSKVDRLR